MKLIKIVRDDGAVLVVGDSAEDYELLAKSGTGNVEVEQFYDAKGHGYGDNLSGYRVKARTFKYTITSHLTTKVSRRFLSYFFSVLHKYTIQSFFNTRKVWIVADLQSPKMTEDMYSHETVEVAFYASDPYWKSLTDTTKSFCTQTALWHYPYAFVAPNSDLPADAYTVFERINPSNTVYIYNDGDAPTEFSLLINGEVVNPKIAINDAEVSYAGTVNVGQTLFIDPTNGVYTLDGKNVLKDITVTNDLQLKVGDNTLTSNAAIVGKINYNKLYNGDV